MRKATIGLIGVALVLSIIALAVIERPLQPAAAPPTPAPLAATPSKAEAPKPTPPEPSAERTVIVNGAEVTAPNLTPEQLAKARGILTDLRTLHGECGAMPRSDLAKCGDLMRANQPRARALDDACADLPIQLKLTLGSAGGHLVMGCSCLMPAAKENLAMATKSLDEAAAILAE